MTLEQKIKMVKTEIEKTSSIYRKRDLERHLYKLEKELKYRRYCR